MKEENQTTMPMCWRAARYLALLVGKFGFSFRHMAFVTLIQLLNIRVESQKKTREYLSTVTNTYYGRVEKKLLAAALNRI